MISLLFIFLLFFENLVFIFIFAKSDLALSDLPLDDASGAFDLELDHVFGTPARPGFSGLFGWKTVELIRAKNISLRRDYVSLEYVVKTQCGSNCSAPCFTSGSKMAESDQSHTVRYPVSLFQKRLERVSDFGGNFLVGAFKWRHKMREGERSIGLCST